MSKLIIKKWNDGDPDVNLLWLHAMQNLANDMLRVNGRLTVYELADALDISSKIEKEKYEYTGWTYPNNKFDDFVDFGLNGEEPVYCILLDDNIDNIELNLNDYPI